MTVEFEIGWRALAAIFILAVMLAAVSTNTGGR